MENYTGSIPESLWSKSEGMQVVVCVFISIGRVSDGSAEWNQNFEGPSICQAGD